MPWMSQSARVGPQRRRRESPTAGCIIACGFQIKRPRFLVRSAKLAAYQRQDLQTLLCVLHAFNPPARQPTSPPASSNKPVTLDAGGPGKTKAATHKKHGPGWVGRNIFSRCSSQGHDRLASTKVWHGPAKTRSAYCLYDRCNPVRGSTRKNLVTFLSQPKCPENGSQSCYWIAVLVGYFR